MVATAAAAAEVEVVAAAAAEVEVGSAAAAAAAEVGLVVAEVVAVEGTGMDMFRSSARSQSYPSYSCS